MTAHLFKFTETNRRPWLDHVARGAAVYAVEVAPDATLAEILDAARAAGVPQGTQRAGVFEVQTDAGIWQHARLLFRERGFGRITPETAVFTPWDQLED